MLSSCPDNPGDTDQRPRAVDRNRPGFLVCMERVSCSACNRKRTKEPPAAIPEVNALHTLESGQYRPTCICDLGGPIRIDPARIWRSELASELPSCAWNDPLVGVEAWADPESANRRAFLVG